MEKRIDEHKSGYGSQTTGIKNGWELIYCEGYLNQDDVKGRERFLKSGSGRKFLRNQLINYFGLK